MRKVSSSTQSLACRLLRTHPAQDGMGSPCRADALQHCCEALRPRIADLVGREGFRGLLARALALARGEFPWLSEVHIDEAGLLCGMVAALAEREPSEGEAAAAAVLAQFLGLLDAFVGAELTRQLVSHVRPDSQIGAAELGGKEDEV